MTTTELRRCDYEVFSRGSAVAIVDGKLTVVDAWVNKLSAQTRVRIDWHWSGGRAQVLVLGDVERHQRVHNMIDAASDPPGIQILRMLPFGSYGLDRDGVDSIVGEPLTDYQMMLVEDLIMEFESTIKYDCHSFQAKYERCGARRELQRRGLSILPAIEAHVKANPPTDEELKSAWGILQRRIHDTAD